MPLSNVVFCLVFHMREAALLVVHFPVWNVVDRDTVIVVKLIHNKPIQLLVVANMHIGVGNVPNKGQILGPCLVYHSCLVDQHCSPLLP